jgi:membrane peptidoglycan carboxypeptidase
MDHSKIPASPHKVHINLATKVRETMDHSAQQYKKVREDIRQEGFIPAMKTFFSELFHSGKKPILYLIGLGILVLILTPIMTYAYFVRDLSSKESILTRKNEGVVLQDRNEKTFFTLYDAQTKNVVPIDQITENTQNAVVAVEDKDFYTHNGFSIEGFGRAIVANVKNESLSQGGSTISQQLVKNTLLSENTKNYF